MEIERKYLVRKLPENLEQYNKKEIAQGYLCTEPVVRIRRSNDDYYMTYKECCLQNARYKNETVVR